MHGSFYLFNRIKTRKIANGPTDKLDIRLTKCFNRSVKWKISDLARNIVHLHPFFL